MTKEKLPRCPSKDIWLAIFIAQCIIISLICFAMRSVTPIFGLLILSLLLRPVRHLCSKIAHNPPAIKQYDYFSTLQNAAKGMTMQTDPKKLHGLIVHIVSREVSAQGCALYTYQRSMKKYVKTARRGAQGMDAVVDMPSDSIFIKWLIDTKKPLLYDALLRWRKKERFFPYHVEQRRNLPQITMTMENMHAALCVPSFLRGEMIGFLILGKKLSAEPYRREEVSLLMTLSYNTAIALENARMHGELNTRIEKIKQLYRREHLQFLDTASAFSYAIATKDGYTHGHALKVAEYAGATARRMEGLFFHEPFDEHFYETIKIASLLHDVGKIGISDTILRKKGPLSHEETEEMKKHVKIGVAILNPIRELKEVFDIIRHHRENYDGTGYPDSLKAQEIPLISRIISVASAYDAMLSDRPYRPARHKEEAIEELKRNAGTQFDPIIVEAFLKVVDIAHVKV